MKNRIFSAVRCNFNIQRHADNLPDIFTKTELNMTMSMTSPDVVEDGIKMVATKLELEITIDRKEN